MKKKSRYQESFRPKFHFSPRTGWMNDPNGLVFYEGEYHLFYQHNPFSDLWGNIHWGHAVSKDLLRWEHLPIALEPDELGYIFSGSVVVDKENKSGFFDSGSGLVAFYTNALKKEGDEFLERQSVAYSKDRGRTWLKCDRNPVIDNPNVDDFRDPKVFWHNGSKKWVMVVSFGSKVRFYGSRDLKNWEYLSEFGENYGSRGGAWECPNLIKLPLGSDGSKWVLGVGDEHGGVAGGSRTQYFVGEFDGRNFRSDNSPEETLWADYGQDFYAPQSWNNLPGDRQLWIGWQNNSSYKEEIPSQGWRGNMSLPRELGLLRCPEGIRLIQRPIDKLRSIRRESREWKDVTVTPESNFSPEISGDTLEILAEVNPGTAREFGLKLRKVGSQEAVVGYRLDREELFLDRENSGKTDFSEKFLDKHRVPLELREGKIELHVFLDKSSLEVFGNKGKRTISSLIFPDVGGKGIKLYAEKGEAEFASLEIHKLKSVWK